MFNVYRCIGETHMLCKHKNKMKIGKQYNKSGIYQKYRCKDCGSIIVGELIETYEKQ